MNETTNTPAEKLTLTVSEVKSYLSGLPGLKDLLSFESVISQDSNEPSPKLKVAVVFPCDQWPPLIKVIDEVIFSTGKDGKNSRSLTWKQVNRMVELTGIVLTNKIEYTEIKTGVSQKKEDATEIATVAPLFYSNYKSLPAKAQEMTVKASLPTWTTVDHALYHADFVTVMDAIVKEADAKAAQPAQEEPTGKKPAK